jgi:hypothetical protein
MTTCDTCAHCVDLTKPYVGMDPAIVASQTTIAQFVSDVLLATQPVAAVNETSTIFLQ